VPISCITMLKRNKKKIGNENEGHEHFYFCA